jgi:hypothetical protein
LVRTTRRITLTHEGSAFLEDCQRLLSDVANAEASVSAGGVKASGHLRSTAPAGFGRRHVAPLVPRFRELHPDVTISLTLSDRVVDLAVNARLDLKWIGEALERTRAALEAGYLEQLDASMMRLKGFCEAAERNPAATDADAFHKAKEALDQLSMRLHETSIARSLQSMSKPGGAGDAPTTG